MSSIAEERPGLRRVRIGTMSIGMRQGNGDIDPGNLVDRAEFAERLRKLALSGTDSSNHVARAISLRSPRPVDASEVIDKGSINQRAGLSNHTTLIEALYAEPPPPHVIVCPRAA